MISDNEFVLENLLLRDLRVGLIKPTAAITRLRSRYAIHGDEARLVAAMRSACREHEQDIGRVLVVIDGDDKSVLRCETYPAQIPAKVGGTIEGLALWAAVGAMVPGRSPRIKTHNQRGELFLHVYIMPKGRYRRQHGGSVKSFGKHVLTFKSWDTLASQAEQPLGEDLLVRHEVGLYSPKRGYQGNDGTGWRSDWQPSS